MIVSERVDLSPPVIDWIQQQLGETVREGRLLPGATTADVIAFTADGFGYVLKLFNKAFFVEEEPDRAVREAAVLETLGSVNVPAPGLIAVDGDGSQCEVPAVLMTRLPGERGVGVPHAREMVEITAELHSSDVVLPWEYERYNHGFDWRPPTWGSDTRLWGDALALVESMPPHDGWSFIHRDYNSTNFLSREGRITGVVDWLSGCMGPNGVDAARIRLDLTMFGNERAAQAVTEEFRRSDHDAIDPFWDVVDAVDLLPFYQGFEAVDLWGDSGRRERLERFIRQALGRL